MTAYIDGAGSNGYGDLIGDITAVDTGAGTIRLGSWGTTLPANASATVSSANMQVSNIGTDVHIKIRDAYRGVNGPASGVAQGSAIAGHPLFCAGSSTSVDIQKATSKAGISSSGPPTPYTASSAGGTATSTTRACRSSGPIFDLRLYTRGECADDLVNLCGTSTPTRRTPPATSSA